MQKKLIYTLGTDLRTSEDFIEILFAYEITAYIDVRSLPRSKLPQFNKHLLSELLLSNSIKYHFFGPELGGFRKGGYTSYIVTDEFFNGVKMLEDIAKEQISVIACAEKFPWKCHRKWISRELQKRGWTVEHIIDKGKVWTPR
jgi:uncharacterized protein (DUF488 family)